LTTLLEGPSLGLSDTSPLVLGAKLALLAAWAALLLLLFAASGRQMLETAEDVRREPFLSFFTGLTGVAALVLTALALTIFLGGLAWAPMLALVALLLLVLKLWGMVAVFYALGDWVARAPWVDFLAADPRIRSNTSVCLKVVDPAVAALAPDIEPRQGADHPFLEPPDMAPHIAPPRTQFGLVEVEHHIGDALAGPMIGELPAPTCAVDRKARLNQLFGFGAGAGGVEGRMLEQPDELGALVPGDNVGARLHCHERRLVIREPFADAPLRRVRGQD